MKSRLIGEDPREVPNTLMPFVAQVSCEEKCKLLVYGGSPSNTINLNTGRGYIVLDVVQSYEKVSGREILYEFLARLSGNVAACFAYPALAVEILDWHTTRGIDEMCAYLGADSR